MDTITLQDALAGFTSNESSALSAYIGTNGKQSIAALAKVVGGQSEAIPSDADLESYVIPGTFYSASSAITNTLSNCPIRGYAFRLEVKPLRKDEQLIEHILTAACNPVREFHRRWNGTTPAWDQNWYEVVTSVVS